jgi:hypothetical protein
MSFGEGEITDILEHDPKSRAGTKWLTPADRLERVLEIVVDGGNTTQIMRALRVPREIAIRLHNDAYEQVWGRITDKRSPEVLATIKDENVEDLLNNRDRCREEVERSSERGNLNVKAVNALNGSIKQLSALLGHNAPTQIETTDKKLFALFKPGAHARVMGNPKAREALVLLEEFAAAQFDAEEQVVIDVVPNGPEGGDE